MTEATRPLVPYADLKTACVRRVNASGGVLPDAHYRQSVADARAGWEAIERTIKADPELAKLDAAGKLETRQYQGQHADGVPGLWTVLGVVGGADVPLNGPNGEPMALQFSGLCPPDCPELRAGP